MTAASAPAMGKDVWTVLELLRWTTAHFTARGVESARLDAECLLAHALGGERLSLYLDFDKPVSADERAAFRQLVQRRANDRVPVAHLTGHKEFWSLPLAITSDVLVPRPETETLVAAALERAPERDAPLRVLDVGTCSGAVALAVASERPNARVVATDISEEAAAVARDNASRLGFADRVEIRVGDLFEPVAGERFDLVLSNPPYLAEGEREGLAPELGHEPEAALIAGPEGSEVLLRLVRGLGEALAPGGAAGFELAPDQAPVVADACEKAGLKDVSVIRDLQGFPRVVAARNAEG